MKNNKVWYIGYLISVVSLIISFAGNHRKSAFIALVIFAAVTFCVTHIMVVHNKMLLKNEEYKIAVNDERTEKIKDKIGTTTSYIMMMFIVISAVVFLYLEYYVPAIFMIFIIFLIPIFNLIDLKTFCNSFKRKSDVNHQVLNDKI